LTYHLVTSEGDDHEVAGLGQISGKVLGIDWLVEDFVRNATKNRCIVQSKSSGLTSA